MSRKVMLLKEHPEENSLEERVPLTRWKANCECPVCQGNDGATRPLGTLFPSGHTTAPAHDGCTCACLPLVTQEALSPGVIVLLESEDDLDEPYLEHLPGKHDQMTHGHGHGGGGSGASSTSKTTSKPAVTTQTQQDTGDRRYGTPEETARSPLAGRSEAEVVDALRPYVRGWRDDMTPAQTAAIKLYTSQEYKLINTALRNGPPIDPKIQKNIDLATQGLTKFELPAAMEMYRGMPDTSGRHWDFFQNAVGQTYTDPAFGSVSRSANVATSFMSGSKTGILFSVHVPEGTQGGFVAAFSHFPQEKEFVLPPGTSYKVLSATTDSTGQRRVVLGVAAPAGA